MKYLGYKNLITHSITMLLCDNKEIRDSVLKIYRCPEKVSCGELKVSVNNWFNITSYMLIDLESRPRLASMAALSIAASCLNDVDWSEVHTDLMTVMNAKPGDGIINGYDLCFERQGDSNDNKIY